MTPNPKLLIFIVSSGLIATLALYLTGWVFALRQQGGGLLICWALGSAALALSVAAPFIFKISLDSSPPKGIFDSITSVFLVFTTMSAFIFPVVIAGVALAIGGVIFISSKAIS